MPKEPDVDQVEDPEEYEELREQEGVSKEEAARRADSDSEDTEDLEDTPTYEKWTDEELEEKAEERGIENYSKMDRQELIDALRENKNV